MSKPLAAVCAFVLLLIAPGAISAPDARPPNIILIMADDMGYECVAANGGESYRTPHLDALAAEGMRFINCYSQPLCTPSRVQIMTGRYNSRNYMRFGLLDPEERTFANLLRDAGYATCVVGKWQLEGGFDGPKHFGFDEYSLWQLTLIGSEHESRYANPTIEQNGEVRRLREGQYGPDVVSEYALDFIERHRDEPFLLYYPMILPHWPFEPIPRGPDWDPKSPGLKGQGQKRYFTDMIAHTDAIVGRLISKLDDLELRDETLVLFTADNGTAQGIESTLDGRPYAGGKKLLTDNGTHVPFIANWPVHIAPGSVNNDLIDFSDFLPTILDAAGLDIPTDRELDGRSFLPQLRGEIGTPRRWIYCWFYRNGRVGEKSGGEFARDHQYKYHLDGRFFDLHADPWEQHPLAETDLTDAAREARDVLRTVVSRYQRPIEETDDDED